MVARLKGHRRPATEPVRKVVGVCTHTFFAVTYGALFDFLVKQVNESITIKDSKRGSRGGGPTKAASIGVLDIFGFAQICHV